ncbi:type II toxin-antitoxin system PemK/MazF family toxin [Candidatus Uabimicrobium sp. HlEnr_7]|uniref:type II toxin-antitoxin system PemK/MazF family toxin n=1 Tax=Candidatus Uabimicrobium helgolandensis TaxID=3095367 RepID=UPI00355887B4
MSNFPKRGEIWSIQFDPKVGSEQGGTRPGVILQNDIGNKFSKTTIVAPLTTTIREMPVHVLLKKKDGVRNTCMLMLEQIHTIDNKRLVKRLGKIPQEKFQDIHEAILYSLGYKSLE